MSSFSFILVMGVVAYALYYYTRKKVTKREDEFNDFAYKMQKDFLENSPAINKGVDYYKVVQDFYTQKGYTLSKHTDYPTDFIGKQGDEILFIRIQGPENKSAISAQVLQNFIGQTVLPVLDDKAHTISWAYVCSKMMCERSAKILLNSYETRVKFELIEAVEPK